MSTLIHRQARARTVEIGTSATLTLDLYNADSSQITITSGIITVKLGTEVLVDAQAVTVGPPASYSLADSVTDGRAPNPRYLETWNVVVGGQDMCFQRRGYLVRCAFHPMINDADLLAWDTDLLAIATDKTDLSQYREEGQNRLEKDLLKKGRRPWLIFDPYMLREAHIRASLVRYYSDQAIAVGDGRYSAAIETHEKGYEKEMSGVTFTYDSDETGDITDNTMETAAPAVNFTSGPVRTGRSWRGRRGGRY